MCSMLPGAGRRHSAVRSFGRYLPLLNCAWRVNPRPAESFEHLFSGYERYGAFCCASQSFKLLMLITPHPLAQKSYSCTGKHVYESHIRRRSSSARATVPGSVYSSSAPNGTPRARRVRFAFAGEVCRQNHFAHGPIVCALKQTLKMDFARSDAVNRIEVPHKYKIQAAIAQCLFKNQLIGGRFNDTKQGCIARRIGTGFA